ncbi:Hypothetical predicted protein [Mytilus galloprovincialis]|uniref:Mab-21-like HhH/H2TH-like domain-containing protein n=1 Tax=Mytilus galloprovincialis TaxID=29158 RepID=A0A8B6H3K4_MYTGA|nr:Hypothetical predicted protein [Mytilus galloprovincialis]
MASLPEEFSIKLDISSSENLDQRLLFLMERAANKVKEVAPIIDYVHQKVADYRKQRPYDTVTVVGSVGNELYFPEVMPDGSYLVEVDVLFNRELPDVYLPVYSPPGETRKTPPLVTGKPDYFLDDEHKVVSTLPIGACLIELTSNINEIDENQRWKFFKELWDGKTYLKSLGYICLIPRQEDPSIFGEVEIEPLDKVKTVLLYRTCRTNMNTVEVDGKAIKLKILVDKVFALKATWPHKLSDFQSREKKWPQKEVVDSIVQDGCLLTHLTSYVAYPLQWKTTFSLAEQQLTTRFSFHQKFLFILLKLVKKKYLDMGVMENGESRVGLTTYHLKTIYLWICETRDPQQFIDYPGTGFLSFLKSLQHCIASTVCPHFFMPTLNVLEGLGHYKKQLTENDEKWTKEHNIQTILINRIDEIIKAPGQFLTDDLLDVIDEKHIHQLQKTIGEAV